MKRSILVFAPLLLVATVAAAADVRVRIRFDSSPEEKLYYAYGEHYRFAHEDIVLIDRDRPGEMEAILELSRAARVRPSAILAMRGRGMSLFEIAMHYRVSPRIFFVSLPQSEYSRLGPSYGRAWGDYHRYRRNWPRTAVLSDDEIIALSRVKFHSSYFRVNPRATVVEFERDPDHRGRVVREFDRRKFKGRQHDRGRDHDRDDRGRNDRGRDDRGHGDRGRDRHDRH